MISSQGLYSETYRRIDSEIPWGWGNWMKTDTTCTQQIQLLPEATQEKVLPSLSWFTKAPEASIIVDPWISLNKGEMWNIRFFTKIEDQLLVKSSKTSATLLMNLMDLGRWCVWIDACRQYPYTCAHMRVCVSAIFRARMMYLHLHTFSTWYKYINITCKNMDDPWTPTGYEYILHIYIQYI